jgi:hypothetical protein
MESLEHVGPEPHLSMPEVPRMLAAEPGPLGEVANRGDAMLLK